MAMPEASAKNRPHSPAKPRTDPAMQKMTIRVIAVASMQPAAVICSIMAIKLRSSGKRVVLAYYCMTFELFVKITLKSVSILSACRARPVFLSALISACMESGLD